MDKLAQIDIGNTFTGASTNLASETSIGRLFVGNFVAAAISLAGVVLLFFLVAGGIGMIAGAGQNDPQKVAQGKKAATSALIGFIVVLAAYWIVQLVERITGLTLIK